MTETGIDKIADVGAEMQHLTLDSASPITRHTGLYPASQGNPITNLPTQSYYDYDQKKRAARHSTLSSNSAQ